MKVKPSWDWFYKEITPEEQAAMAEGRLAAIVREDGDDNAAIVECVKSINAPAENTRFATYDPCVGDCILVVAWDDRTIECEPEDDYGWSF